MIGEPTKDTLCSTFLTVITNNSCSAVTFLLFPLLAAVNMVFKMYSNLPFGGLVPDKWMF